MEVCGDMGAQGAYCVHTQTDETREIPLAAWNIERVGRLSITAKDYARQKAVIEKLCRQTKKCSGDVGKTFTNIDKTLKNQ